MKVDILYRYPEGDDQYLLDVAQVVIAIDGLEVIRYEHNDQPMVKSAAFIDGMRAYHCAVDGGTKVDVELFYKADYPT